MKSDLSFQLESAAWPAFVVEAGGTIRHANQAALAVFGAKLAGEGLSLSALWAEPGETAGQFLARLERSAATVVPLRFQGKGGSVTAFTTYICAVRDVQKRYLFQLIKGAEVPAAAVPDLSRLGVPEGKPSGGETALFQKQKLDSAMHLTRTLASDFNNVLTSILGHTSLVLAQMEIEHPFRASLLEVEKAAGKAAEIASHLASFSRPEKEPQARVTGNLNAAVRRVLETVQKSRPSAVRWQVQLEDPLYSVRFDEAKVPQALSKVLDNCLEALGENGCVTLTTRNLDITEPTQDCTARLSPGSYVCIEIADDGKGIDGELLPRIFEPFFSTKQGHRGLGLAWVYGVITNHRGGVAITSAPQQGTSVRIYLPASQEIVSETAFFQRAQEHQKTILLVDDEELLLTMGRTVLSSFGYNVLTASSGEKALKILAESIIPVDLVITDLVMPQMSGRELIERIQGLLPDLPVLRTSGYVRAGADDEQFTFLQKPFTTQALILKVKQLLPDSPDLPAVPAA